MLILNSLIIPSPILHPGNQMLSLWICFWFVHKFIYIISF